MSTMGLRGVLAATLIVSTGLLTGMAALPSEAEASLAIEPATDAAAFAEPGMLDRIKSKACEISLAATRRDRSSTRERSQDCRR